MDNSPVVTSNRRFHKVYKFHFLTRCRLPKRWQFSLYELMKRIPKTIREWKTPVETKTTLQKLRRVLF